ncbi:MAG: hypothetical protein HYY25_04670 [Candidatus Wallbacteria bacterium]|nr:hypothetical protein [Candidatus Wallbacteria bacterium]
MSRKRRGKVPPAGPKVWITIGLIVLGVVMIVIVNADFARQSGERDSCLQAQERVAQAVRQAAANPAARLDDPAKIPAQLALYGGLQKLPPHPGSPDGAPSPLVFARGGGVYCPLHGAVGGKGP